MNRTVVLRSVLFLGLLLAATGELLLQASHLNHYGPWTSPLVWLACGVCVSVAGFGLFTFRRGRTELAPERTRPLAGALCGLAFLIAAYVVGGRMAEIFAAFPIGPEHSDIVPAMQLYVRRMLAGENAYAPQNFGAWTVDPVYFPVTWLPYTFSELLDIDYRWTAYGVFLLASAIYLGRVWRGGAGVAELLLKTALPFVYLLQFINNKPSYLGHAVELLPTGMYLLLALTVFRKSPWVMALGIGLCLLSRYALSFWIPVYLLLIWGERGFRTAFLTGLGVAAMVLGIYVLPFLSRDWESLPKGLAYYQTTATDQWYPQRWQQPGEPPTHLFRGLSFAPWFYDNTEYEVEDRLRRNKKFHLVASLTAAVLLLVGYFWLRRRQHFNARMYALIGLKFFLTVFYAWLYVPFAYLYMLPCLLTLTIIWEFRIKILNEIT